MGITRRASGRRRAAAATAALGLLLGAVGALTQSGAEAAGPSVAYRCDRAGAVDLPFTTSVAPTELWVTGNVTFTFQTDLSAVPGLATIDAVTAVTPEPSVGDPQARSTFAGASSTGGTLAFAGATETADAVELRYTGPAPATADALPATALRTGFYYSVGPGYTTVLWYPPTFAITSAGDTQTCVPADPRLAVATASLRSEGTTATTRRSPTSATSATSTTATTGRVPSTTRPTPPTTPSPFCRYRDQLPPWLWDLLANLLGLSCPPPGAPTTTTSTTRPTPSTTGGFRDCGTWSTATGWPTTFARTPSTCLLDAFASGTPARYVLRTPTGGDGTQLLTTTYEVIGLRRVRVTVDPTTAAWPGGITVSECTELADPGFGRNPSVGGCTEISSTPVTAPSTGTTVEVTPSAPVVAGQPVTLTATVRTAAGAIVPAGTVTLVESIYHRGTSAVNAGGQTAFTVSRAAGSWTFTAVYNGTPQYRSSRSAPVTVVVTPAP